MFHKISNAYTTLVDRQSRDSYDRFGPNEEIMEREAARRQQQYRNASAEMDFDEFIFQQFFGGGMARGGTHLYFRNLTQLSVRRKAAEPSTATAAARRTQYAPHLYPHEHRNEHPPEAVRVCAFLLFPADI